MTVIVFSPAVGPVPLSCILSEKHRSSIEITENPIETGAAVNDHAYIRPKRVMLEVADDNASITYNAIVRFQESRVPFTLVTGLSVYRNMLVKDIEADRDKRHSRILYARIECQEAIIVDTAYASSVLGSTGEQFGAAGGLKSLTAAAPSPSRSGDAITADRAAGIVQRGDSPASTVTNGGSILNRIF